jgi:hypothetical protein
MPTQTKASYQYVTLGGRLYRLTPANYQRLLKAASSMTGTINPKKFRGVDAGEAPVCIDPVPTDTKTRMGQGDDGREGG